VPASAVTLTDLSDVMNAGPRRPGIGADRDLCAIGALAQRDVIGGLREEIIGNELVIALDARTDEIKCDDALRILRTLFDGFDA
jgi:hypothetical protein